MRKLRCEYSGGKEVPGEVLYLGSMTPAESKDDEEAEVEAEEPEPDFRRDIPSICLLFFLYILQGIPLGLIATIPFVLQARSVPYTSQAQFSIAHWPFSFKVLFAPIVDNFYFPALGRRKSWLIPMQYLIGIFFLVLAYRIDGLLEAKNVSAITAVFFILNLLAATQDVSVDGWALTMLSRGNVGYASTCNAVGQTLGAVISYSGFLALNSKDFANKYFRSVPGEEGLVSLPQFLFFWGVVFLITTTLVLIFKKEEKESEEVASQHLDLVGSYVNLWKILKLKNIQYLIAFYFTAQIGIAANNALSRLKFVEKGLPREQVAFFTIPLIPFKLLIPILISKFTVGNNSMGVWINAYPIGLIFGIIFPIAVYLTPTFKIIELDGSTTFPVLYYVILFCIIAAQLLPGYTMFVAGMAFSAKISDPAIGGTYMTLINTVSNMGSMWTNTVALWLVDYVAIPLGDEFCLGEEAEEWKKLFRNTKNTTIEAIGSTINAYSNSTYSLGGGGNFSNPDLILLNSNSSSVNDLEPSSVNGFIKSCLIDGYYVESLVCVILGFLWIFWGRPTILMLQKRPISSWRVFK